MDKLLTQQELVERWNVTTRAIEKWRKEGVLTPAKGVPVIRFAESYIRELEGVKLEQVSPLKLKKLERELEETKKENNELKKIISQVQVISSGLYHIGG